MALPNGPLVTRRKWGQLDGQRLQFWNAHCPTKRNLYLHSVLAYMGASTGCWQGDETLDQKLFSTDSYATPEAFVRSNMLRWMEEMMGSNLPENKAELAFTTNADVTMRLITAYLKCRVKELAKQFSMPALTEDLKLDHELGG